MGSTRLSRRDLLAQAGSLAALGCIGGPGRSGGRANTWRAAQRRDAVPDRHPEGAHRSDHRAARRRRVAGRAGRRGSVGLRHQPGGDEGPGPALAHEVRLEGPAGAHEPAAAVQGARRGLRHPLRARARLRPEPAADRLQPRVAEHVPGVCEGRRAAGASRKARRPGRRRLLGRRPVASRLRVLVQTAQADRRADDGAALGPVDDRRPRLSRLHRAGRRPRIHHFPRDRLSGRELPRDPPQPPARHRRTVGHRPRRRRRKRSARTGRKSRAPTWRSSARSR